MDIPQEISEKIASYIRRPSKDEDIIITIGRDQTEDRQFLVNLDQFINRCRKLGAKESVIQRHAQWIRRLWAQGKRDIYILII